MGSDRTGASAAVRRQPWTALFGLGLILSAALLLPLRADLGFFLDDWALVIGREGSPTDWLLPHNEHIVVLPAAIYKLSLAVFGISAIPLHLVSVALFLTSVVLLHKWLKPLIGEPASVLGCLILLFLGASAEDLLWAFQMGFFGSVAGGLGAMLLIRRGTAGGDGWACLLLVVSVLFSSLAIPFAVGAAAQLLLRDGWRKGLGRSWVILVPAAVFIGWWLGWGHLAESGMSVHNAVRAPVYVLAALAYAVASLTGLFPLHELNESYLWAIPGLGIALLLLYVVHRRRKVPPELLVALAIALTFWLLSGLNLIPGRGFHTSRYQYPGVIFVLMILGGAFAGLRPNRQVLRWLVLLTAASLLGNIAVLIYSFKHSYSDYAERNQISYAAFDLPGGNLNLDSAVGISNDDRALVYARDYEAATDKYGSPALDENEIESASVENRERLDQLLVGTLGIKLVPARTVTPVKSGCRVLTADATASETTEVEGRLLWIRSDQPAFIQLGRFGPGASATAWFTGAGKPTGYLIPPDLSDQPWRIGFAGAGKVTVCPARPAK